MKAARFTKNAAPVAAMAAMAWFAYAALGVLPRSSDPSELSSAALLRHVERLAAQPHPAGSAAHASVLEWLLGELRALGVEPELQTAYVEAPWWLSKLPWLEPEEGTSSDTTPRSADGRPLVPLTNVLVRVPGSSGKGAVLVQAHYDSATRAPGAGDDAAAVAALLEMLRALLSGAPYANDLIFHFDDGEELGLLGARLFLEEHPWMADVRCVLNFEARGNAGPSICFEVGRGSAPLVELFAKAAQRPIGTSLAAAVYARLPNDTSFSPFREQGLPGLNFAFIGGVSAYHRPWDTPANLSGATLLHQADYALAMTRAAAEVDLDALGSADAVFFNVLPSKLAVYPLSWALALGIAQAVLAAAVLARATRAGIGPGAGLAHALLHGALVFLAVRVVWIAVDFAVRGGLSLLVEHEPRGNLPTTTLTALGVAGVGFAASLGLLGRSSDLRRAQLAAGGALLWLLLLLFSTFLLPAGSYVFGWPLFFALPVLWRATRPGLARQGAPSYGALGVALFSFGAIALLFAPAYYLLVQVGSTSPPRMASFAAALTALCALLAQPHLGFLLGKRRFTTAALAGAIGLAGLVAAGVTAAIGY